MTISSEVRKAGPYTGNNVTSSFPFAFKVFSSADLYVLKTTLSTGADTELTLTTDYTVSLNADQNATPGGTITLTAGALASTYSVTITSQLEYKQPTDLTNQGGFYPSVITDALDRLTILAQQLYEKINKTLKLSISTPNDVSTDLPAPVAGRVLGWSADGKNIENKYIGTSQETLALLETSAGSSFIGHSYPEYSAGLITGAISINSSERIIDAFYLPSDGADWTPALQRALNAIGSGGHLLITSGTKSITSTPTFYLISCGKIKFQNGAILSPTAGSSFIIDAEIVAGNYKIFDTGRPCIALHCDASTSVYGWSYQFQLDDVGKSIYFPFGGAEIGYAPVGNFVKNRLGFLTSVESFINANQITIASPITTAIRQDYVVDSIFAPSNTGIAIVGNGTFEFTKKVGISNVEWFGALTNSSGQDNSGAFSKAMWCFTRRYGGGNLHFPGNYYEQTRDITIDVHEMELTGRFGKTILKRANGIPLEQMNNIRTVWRGRYGGGGQVKSSENWSSGSWLPSSGSTSPKWLGDWYLISSLVLDRIQIDGNKANQPSLAAGTGIDSWDAGFSALYCSKVLIKNTCSFVNCLRWGAALSTLSNDSSVEDGTYFENNGEGDFYAETSSNIHCGSIVSKNSPSAGWNMGAVTFLHISGGSVNSPKCTGSGNGIYLRDGCSDITVNIGKQKSILGKALWMKDESLGSNRLKRITVNGGSSDSCASTFEIGYVDGLILNNVIGTNNSGNGGYIYQCTDFNVSDNSVKGATVDIVIDAGTVNGVIKDNNNNVKLQGTSSTYITVETPEGYTFTDTSSGTGYLAAITRPNYGDGKGRHKFSSGGVDFSGAIYSNPLVIGASYYWTEVATGKFRTKTIAAGFPSADNDGTVVGTQV